MNLVQILLPTAGNDGEPFPDKPYTDLRHELIERFGGVTVFSEGPADGFWKEAESTIRDEIIIFEIMAEAIDASWWGTLRQRLEGVFHQDKIIVRAQEIRLL